MAALQPLGQPQHRLDPIRPNHQRHPTGQIQLSTSARALEDQSSSPTLLGQRQLRRALCRAQGELPQPHQLRLELGVRLPDEAHSRAAMLRTLRG